MIKEVGEWYEKMMLFDLFEEKAALVYKEAETVKQTNPSSEVLNYLAGKLEAFSQLSDFLESPDASTYCIRGHWPIEEEPENDGS